MSESQRINKIGEVLRRERRQNERLDHLQPLVWTQEQAERHWLKIKVACKVIRPALNQKFRR